MFKYQITNLDSGADLGTYLADDESQALDVMAQEAGYTDYANAISAVGSSNLSVDLVQDSSDENKSSY